MDNTESVENDSLNKNKNKNERKNKMATKTLPAKKAAPAAKSKPAPAEKPKQKTETTALVDLKTLLPNVEDFAPALTSGGSGNGPGLPVYKLVWPIEAPKPHIGKCVVTIGADSTPLLKPYIVSCLGVRNMARELVPGSGGQQVYNRKYEGGKTNEEYQRFVTEGKQQGKSILLALIPDAEESDSCYICMMDIAGTAESYFLPCFAEGLFGHGKGSLISCVDHMPHLVESKKDKAKKYYAPWKFTQHCGQDLTNEQKVLIAESVAGAADAIGIWKAQ